MEPQVSRPEPVGRFHLPGQRHLVMPSMDVFSAKLIRMIVGEDEKLTSKTKVDVARLPPCHPAFKPHLLRVNHRVALYKRADESILEKTNSYDDG